MTTNANDSGADTGTTIYVDADACPVKDETYKVAGRYGLTVLVVANQYLNVPLSPRIRFVRVDGGMDAADDWIAERATGGDIVVTADIPLAARCVESGALVLTPRGRIHDESSVGGALATRDLMTALREANPTEAMGGGPPPMTRKDRSNYLQSLDTLVHRARR